MLYGEKRLFLRCIVLLFLSNARGKRRALPLHEAVLLHEASAAAAIGAIGTAANYLCKASATLLQRFC